MIYGKSYYESKKGILLKPTIVMFKYKKYNIVSCHPGYHIKKYYIIVNNKNDRLIQDVIICDCCHPNAWGGEVSRLNVEKPPKFSKFCLPNDVKGAKLISDLMMKKYEKSVVIRPDYAFYSDIHIRYMLMMWSLDNPHHYPLREHLKTNPPLPKEIIE